MAITPVSARQTKRATGREMAYHRDVDRRSLDDRPDHPQNTRHAEPVQATKLVGCPPGEQGAKEPSGKEDSIDRPDDGGGVRVVRRGGVGEQGQRLVKCWLAQSGCDHGQSKPGE